MMNMLKNLFGGQPKEDLGTLLAQGATILDVRSPSEYASGHIKGSINMPLNTLPSNMNKLKKDQPIITCCASGMRSESARAQLAANGFVQVVNAGSWSSLKRYEQ